MAKYSFFPTATEIRQNEARERREYKEYMRNKTELQTGLEQNRWNSYKTIIPDCKINKKIDSLSSLYKKDKYIISNELLKNKNNAENLILYTENYKFRIILKYLSLIFGFFIISSVVILPIFESAILLLLCCVTETALIIYFGYKAFNCEKNLFPAKIKIANDNLDIVLKKIKKSEKNFNDKIKEHNLEIDTLEQKYNLGDAIAITKTIGLLFPDLLLIPVYTKKAYFNEKIAKTTNYNFNYNSDLKQLTIKAELPNKNSINKEVGYKYITQRDVVETIYIKDKTLNDIYNSILCQIIVLIAQTVFHIDYNNHILSVKIYGFVDDIDKSSGHDIKDCYISTCITKEQLFDINLNRVDAIEFLKKIKYDNC